MPDYIMVNMDMMKRITHTVRYIKMKSATSDIAALHQPVLGRFGHD